MARVKVTADAIMMSAAPASDAGKQTYNILSLDGGPAGMLQVRMLRKLEDAVPGFLAATDVFVGTSFGSMIMLFLASRMPDDREQAIKLSPAILDDAIQFSNQIMLAMQPTLASAAKFLLGIGPITTSQRLRAVLEGAIGNMRMRDLTRIAACASMSMNEFTPRSFRFVRESDELDGDMLIVDAMMASGSLPMYFDLFGNEEGNHFLDGAFVANNPSMMAVAHLLRQFSSRSERSMGPATADELATCRVLSLGVNDSVQGLHQALTGIKLLERISGDAMKPGALPWGLLQFIISRPSLLAALFYQGQNSEVARQCAALLGCRYHFRYAPCTTAFADLGEVMTGRTKDLIPVVEHDAQTLWNSPAAAPASKLTRELVKFVKEEWMSGQPGPTGSRPQ